MNSCQQCGSTCSGVDPRHADPFVYQSRHFLPGALRSRSNVSSYKNIKSLTTARMMVGCAKPVFSACTDAANHEPTENVGSYAVTVVLNSCIVLFLRDPLGHRLALKTPRFRPTLSSQSLIILVLGSKLWLDPTENGARLQQPLSLSNITLTGGSRAIPQIVKPGPEKNKNQQPALHPS